jgi:hypothetical protein
MIRSMRSRASLITVALTLLTCLVCPLVEMFDRWDDTLRTGNDVEYALVVLALCIGVAYLFARLVFRFPLLRSAAELISDSSAHRPLASAPPAARWVIPIPISPPALALRI